MFEEFWFPCISKWYHIGVTSAISLINKKLRKKFKKVIHPITIVLSLIVIFVLGPYLFYTINFMGRIYPNIYIGKINIGGMSYQTAVKFISKEKSYAQEINLSYQGKTYEIDTNDIGLNYDYEGTAARAFNLVRTGNFILDTYERVNLLLHPITIGYSTQINEEKLDENISRISSDINKDPVEAKFTFDGKKVTEFQTSSNGLNVDGKALKSNIILGLTSFEIPTQVVYPNVTTDQINNLGIKELIGTGSSTYFHSIPGRVFNVTLQQAE